jgi:RNA polymerase sigma-70 factor (ECF subfamily)
MQTNAMQEAMFKAALHLKRFHSGSDFKPWLYRIATREAFKCLRWNRRHICDVPHLPADGDQDHPVDRVVATHGSPAEILERKEFAAAVLTALKSLNPIYRDIFVACDLRQSPVTEAAQVLGINISTANTRLHRARLLMRKRLSDIQLP